MGLPVITFISDSSGNQLQPAEELRFKSPLTVTRVVPAAGPKRIEIGMTAPTPAPTPTNLLVPQAAVLAAGPATMRFVLAAATLAPVNISRIQFIPHADTLQSDTNYARFGLAEYGPSGTWTRYLFDPYYGSNVQDFLSMGTDIFFIFTPPYTIPQGSTLVVEWSKVGAGADVNGATWVII